MERAKRFCAKVLLVLGGLLTFEGVVGLGVAFTHGGENRAEVLLIMFLCALMGVGLLWLASVLLRRPGTAEQSAAPAPKAPKPKKPETQPQKDLKKQLEEERRQREAQWKAEQELRRKQRLELLQPWSHLQPEDTEHIPQWIEALDGECKMARHYLWRGAGDEGLDGVHDYTGTDWFWLHPESELEKAIDLYAQLDTHRKVCEVHDVYPRHTDHRELNALLNRNHDRRFLLISSQEEFDALGENRERCIALCAEHDLHIVTDLPGHRYKDHISGNIYEIYVSGTFPGSADDAATYGALGLRAVQPEGSPDR